MQQWCEPLQATAKERKDEAYFVQNFRVGQNRQTFGIFFKKNKNNWLDFGKCELVP